MKEIWVAVISAVTSLLVVVVTYGLTSYRESKAKEQQEIARLNSKYLNPLRFYLVENYFRLSEILRRVAEAGGKDEALIVASSAEEISNQSAEWFNGYGCYLISSCYLTARLFYQLDKVRQELPYLRLNKQDDTELITLITKVSRCFRQGHGVYYLLQPSIGNDLYLAEQKRLKTYREFCQSLQNPQTRVWFDRLLSFYIETGNGQKLKRIEDIIAAIQELSQFLDRIVGGGNSIRERLEIEGIRSL